MKKKLRTGAWTAYAIAVLILTTLLSIPLLWMSEILYCIKHPRERCILRNWR